MHNVEIVPTVFETWIPLCRTCGWIGTPQTIEEAEQACHIHQSYTRQGKAS